MCARAGDQGTAMNPHEHRALRVHLLMCGNVDVQEQTILGLRQRRSAGRLWASRSRDGRHHGAGGHCGRLRWRPAQRALGRRRIADPEKYIDPGSAG